jgi:carboxymethylenebutenolidase
MNNKIFIKSADDKDLPVYIYEPSAARIGAVVLIQEIFGVNDHINNIAENLAKEGFVTWVPDLFYRVEDNVNLSYTSEDIKKGKSLKDELGWELPTMDIISCIANLKVEHNVATVGFCYGGTLSWNVACSAYGLDAAVCFYGSQITNFLTKEPKCPTQVHLGKKDSSINTEAQNKIIDFSKQSQTNIEVFNYENADHGFFCDQRDSYHKESADLSYIRTLEFLKKLL